MENDIGQLGFYPAHRIGLLIVSFALAAVVFELVRRGRLKERYALLWLAVSGAGLIVGIFPQFIVWVSVRFDFQYLTVFYLFSFLFLLGIVLTFTVVISRLTERNRDLAQEVALLNARVQKLEGRKDE
jgi:hypothetical protein